MPTPELDPAVLQLRDLTSEAVWTLSTCKQGFGVQQLLDRLLDPRAPRRELGRRLRVEGVRGHRDGVLGGAVLHHHLVDHVEVAPRRRVVLVAAVLLELRRRDAAADGLWRGAVRELWRRGAVDERG